MALSPLLGEMQDVPVFYKHKTDWKVPQQIIGKMELSNDGDTCVACSVLDHSPQGPSESCMIKSGKVRVLPSIHGHGELVLLAAKAFQYN